jgi:hypothetical protein
MASWLMRRRKLGRLLHAVFQTLPANQLQGFD